MDRSSVHGGQIENRTAVAAPNTSDSVLTQLTPNIIVGDYTYYDDFENVENFEKNVKYLFDFVNDKLIIGKFCMIASDVKFIMNGANHLTQALSTYPFAIFGNGWENAME